MAAWAARQRFTWLQLESVRSIALPWLKSSGSINALAPKIYCWGQSNFALAWRRQATVRNEVAFFQGTWVWWIMTRSSWGIFTGKSCTQNPGSGNKSQHPSRKAAASEFSSSKSQFLGPFRLTCVLFGSDWSCLQPKEASKVLSHQARNGGVRTLS